MQAEKQAEDAQGGAGNRGVGANLVRGVPRMYTDGRFCIKHTQPQSYVRHLYEHGVYLTRRVRCHCVSPGHAPAGRLRRFKHGSCP